MTREQQQTTRELEAAEGNWLRSYGWRLETAGGRWSHPTLERVYMRSDAMALTKAQPLVLGAAMYARRA